MLALESCNTTMLFLQLGDRARSNGQLMVRYFCLPLHYLTDFSHICCFVCIEVLRPSRPCGVMLSAVSLPYHTFTGQALSFKWLTSIVHILSPETDNCPSWISGKERMTLENISWSISTKEWCRPGGVEPATSWSPVGRASNWATEVG